MEKAILKKAKKVIVWDYSNYCGERCRNGGDYLLWTEFTKIGKNKWKRVERSSCELISSEEEEERWSSVVSEKEMFEEVMSAIESDDIHIEVTAETEGGEEVMLKEAKRHHKDDYSCFCAIE